MKRATLWTAALAAAVIMIPAIVSAQRVTLPKGTDVPLVFDQEISSKSAHKGDKVALHIESDVVINGQTVFTRDTPVVGVVTQVKKRSNFGVNGQLRITFNPIKSALGASVDITPRFKGKQTGSRTDHSAEISGGTAILLGPVGLVGGYFVVGKQVNIKKGDRLMSEVARDTTIVIEHE